MAEMSDKELIGYCDIHCETPRALFHRDQVNRMLALAGHPKNFAYEVSKYQEWLSVHEEMKELCELARKRIELNSSTVIPDNVIKFPVREHA